MITLLTILLKNSTDCSSKYGCFYSPKDCAGDQCEFVAKWRQVEDKVEFVIGAKFGDLKRNWLAIGFSHDKSMVVKKLIKKN